MRAIRILLVVTALAGAAPAGAVTDVPVRCGDHGERFRLVLDLPRDAELRAQRFPALVRLRWPSAWQLRGREACMDAISALHRLDVRGSWLEIGFAPSGAGVRAFTLSGPPRWVVDLGQVESNLSLQAPLPPVVPAPAPPPPLVPEEPGVDVAKLRERALRQGPEAVIPDLESRLRKTEEPGAALGFLLGSLLEEGGDRLRAAQLLWQTAKSHPGHPDAPRALRRSADIFNQLGFHYEAHKPLQGFLRFYTRHPDRAEVQLELGRAYALARAFGEAREELIPLVYDQPGAVGDKARLWLAYLLMQEGRMNPADEQFAEYGDEVQDYLRDEPELLFAAGKAALGAGRAERADRLFSIFQRLYSGNYRLPEVRLRHAMALGQLGRWSDARQRYNQVLQREPEADLTSLARVGMVEARQALGEVTPDAAVAQLDHLARGMPYSEAAVRARRVAARILEEEGERAGALAQLGFVLDQGTPAQRRAVRPQVDRLLPEEMRVALEEGDPFRAYRLYNRYAGSPPGLEVSRLALNTLARLRAFRAAQGVLEQVAPHDAGTVERERLEARLAEAYAEAGAADGVGWIDSVLATNPDHNWTTELRMARARILFQQGAYGAMRDFIAEHEGLAGLEADLLRARSLAREGRPGDGYRVLDNRLGKMEAPAAPLLAEAGDLAARAGRPYSARRYWERALAAGEEEGREELPRWQREQLWTLLGIDAMQREDFSGAEQYLEQAANAEGAFGRAASLIQSLEPVLKERLR